MAIDSRVPVWRRSYKCIKCGSKTIKTAEPHYNNDIESKKIRCKNCRDYFDKCYNQESDQEVKI